MTTPKIRKKGHIESMSLWFKPHHLESLCLLKINAPSVVASVGKTELEV